MPAEVISLLSSPDLAPAGATRKPKSPPRTKPSYRMSRLRNPFEDDDYDDLETLDLTADSQDKTKTATRTSDAIESDSDLLLCDEDPGWNPRHGRSKPVNNHGDRSSEPTKDPEDWGSPARKRQRTTPPAEKDAARPDTFQTWSFSRLNSADTKDPVMPTKSKLREADLDVDDDDPFASSPPQPPVAQGHAPSWGKHTTNTVENIDLLSSSPPPEKEESHVTEPPRKSVAWDPISSSAPLPDEEARKSSPEAKGLRRTVSEAIAVDSSDDEDFPDLDGFDPSGFDIAKYRSKVPARRTKASAGSRPRTTKPGGSARAPAVKKTPEEKAREAEAREAEKQRKLKEKVQEKEERALERKKAAALAEVNKIRTDKKVSTPEMIVDLPASLSPTIRVQAEALLKDLDVEACTWNSPVDDVIKWRRKVKSRYVDELERWEPIPLRIDEEKYAMVIMPAAQFVTLALNENGNASLDSHVQSMQFHFPNVTIIYLIEGLTPWLRKNKNLRNRQFVSAVRSGLPVDEGEPEQQQQPPPSTQQQPSRRRKTAAAVPQQYIDEDTIEDALLQLQVLHSVLIHHTATPLETAQWIAVFTQHISTVPYRRQREDANASAAGFCMETGQVRTGDGPRDTYTRMLQEIGRVTAPIAYGIAGEFGTVRDLVRGLEEGGPLVLERVRKSANKDGAFSDRAVGQAVSRRVWKIFMGRDESSTDI
ncbi:ERCC4 domain-containing protein [Echria macrotheca]|uniref:ERCC4 domain-containing protein n=1 Tax=Echria macrotheca TaxID=438768 RepID=A0AAJ0FAJ7_9PEZI|nr:ERCC4 domain-containing protein [Echria macrotheca]